MAGGDAFELQARLGYASLEITKRYVHLAQELAQTQCNIESRRPSRGRGKRRSGSCLSLKTIEPHHGAWGRASTVSPAPFLSVSGRIPAHLQIYANGV